MANLAILGGGQIGSRHLQGLARLTGEHQIWVVDPSADALAVSQQRFDEVAGASSRVQVSYCRTLQDLPAKIDVGFVTTNSGVRRKAVESLLEVASVEHLVLEKVLFANFKDFDWANEKLRGRSAYVNCPLRMTEWVKSLAQRNLGEPLSLRVSGAALGLGCNSIHYIDLFNYITGRPLISVETKFLEAGIVNSKRNGYFEVFGELLCDFGAGYLLSLRSLRSGNVPCALEIVGSSLRQVVAYTAGNSGTVERFEEASDWQMQTESFTQPLQSQLSNAVVESLLERGTCNLTPLTNSIQLHLPFVRALSIFLAEQGAKGDFDCPIT